MRSAALPCILIAIAGVACARSGSTPVVTLVPASRDSAMFIIGIGQDTSRYLWIVRDGQRLTTTSANRIPSLRVLRGETVLDANEAVAQLEQSVFDPGSAEPNKELNRTRIWTQGDSTTVETGLDPAARRLNYRGRAQFINTSHYFETLATIQVARIAIGDSLVGQHFAGTLFPPQRFVVRRLSATDATAWSRPLGVVRLSIGPAGHVVQFDGAGTSALNFTGRRVPWRDIDMTVAELLRQERAGRRFGALSSRDTAAAEIAGSRIVVDYGKPLKRGRVIFGNIVPWDTVWRTGANAATHFKTDRPLDFAGRVLPAGEYTMWTVPSRAGWTLILNSQTRQWGTEHDPTRDVLRVLMRSSTLASPVEALAIAVEPTGEGGVLRLRWDLTEAWIPFSVR